MLHLQMNFFCCIAGSAFELLKNYVVKFQDKQCCFADLKLYMGLLEDEETTKVSISYLMKPNS